MSADPFSLIGVVVVLLVVLGISTFIFNSVVQSNILCGWDKHFCCNETVQSSYCFDPIKRCSLECNNIGTNFTGNITGPSDCMCDCGTYVVSYCSGFAYKLQKI